MSFTGHGFGAGAGMGQWGALGDALGGQTYNQILTTYYGTLGTGGSTTVGALPNGWTDAATDVTVAVTANAGSDIIVTSDSPFTVDGSPLAAHAGARFHQTAGGNQWEVDTSPASGPTFGCAGPWTPLATGVASPTATPGAEPFPSDGNLAAEALQLCELPTDLTVRGTLQGTVNSDGAGRTVNVLPLGQYVADVTPAESPVSWAALGGEPGSRNWKPRPWRRGRT